MGQHVAIGTAAEAVQPPGSRTYLGREPAAIARRVVLMDEGRGGGDG